MKRIDFATSPIDTARPLENQRLDETRGRSKTSISCETSAIILILCGFKSTFSYKFSEEPLNLLPQNRCFVRSFRQFSSHLTKCHACHGTCTLSPLDAALPMRFAKNTQHDTSKVPRLPRKMRWTRPKCCARHENCNASSENVAKVLRLPHKTTFNTVQNTSECHEVPRLPRKTKRTVADGCGRKRNVARTHPQPPDPQSETGTLATHSGINYHYSNQRLLVYRFWWLL